MRFTVQRSSPSLVMAIDVAVESSDGSGVGGAPWHGGVPVGAGQQHAVVLKEDPVAVAPVAFADEVLRLDRPDLHGAGEVAEPAAQRPVHRFRRGIGQPDGEQVDVGSSQTGDAGGQSRRGTPTIVGQ